MRKSTLFGKTFLLLTVVLCTWQTGMGQIIPGEGGSIPGFTSFDSVPGKVGCLYVRSSQRENNYFYSGTRALVDLQFLPPSTFGADSYTLQYSADGGSTWLNYQNNGFDLTTTGDNFSLNFNSDYKLRLLLNGGNKNGYTSNEVYAPLSDVDTQFAGWNFDESFYISGVMSPNVGRGLLASFIVRKLSDESDISGFLTYQWYRVNPVTYEMTAIQGATGLTDTTTMADAGYYLMIKATGDGINVGGFVQVMSFTKSVVPNKASVSNVTNTGFTLNLYKSVSSLNVNDLTLYDKNYNPVTITSVSKGTNSAIYDITVPLDTAKSPYYMENNSAYWHIVSSLFGGEMMMESGVSIKFNIETDISEVRENALSVYPVPAGDFINFKLNNTINQVAVININGQVLLQSIVNENEGTLSTSELKNGIYFLRIVSSKGVMMKKFQILK
jgi:hypothetical protein